MAITRTPLPPQKKPGKAGWGCFGCGCLIVVLLFLLGVGLIGGLCYFTYKEAYSVTTDSAAPIPAFNGSEDVYPNAQKKVDAFNQDVAAKKPSTLTLSADEINALITHNINQNADIKQFKPQVLVSMNGSDVRLQGNVTLEAFPGGLFKGRFFNIDATSGVTFDPATKDFTFQLKKVHFGPSDLPESSLASMSASLSQSFNQKIRQNTAAWSVLQNAKWVEVKDGQFVIETQ